MYESLDDVRNAVESNENVLTLEMRVIRNAYGADRLGKDVRANISRELRGRGIGHYPNDLPDYQHIPVRLYKLGSEVAELVDAVLSPDATHDRALRDAVSGRDKTIVRKIKELVGE